MVRIAVRVGPDFTDNTALNDLDILCEIYKSILKDIEQKPKQRILVNLSYGFEPVRTMLLSYADNPVWSPTNEHLKYYNKYMIRWIQFAQDTQKDIMAQFGELGENVLMVTSNGNNPYVSLPTLSSTYFHSPESWPSSTRYKSATIANLKSISFVGFGHQFLKIEVVGLTRIISTGA